MSQDEEDAIRVTLSGAAEGTNGHLRLLANFSSEGESPDEIESVVIDYDPETDEGEVTHAHEGWLTAMVPTDSGEWLCVSADGELVRFRSGRFAVSDLGLESALNDVTLVPGAGYVAVGDGGALLEAKRIGTKPRRLTFGPDLYAVRAVASNAKVAVGDRGSVWLGDGAAWTKLDVPTEACLFAVAMIGERHFYVGGEGVLFRFTSDRPEPVAIPPEMTLYALAAWEGRLLAAAGEHGLFSLGADGTLRTESDAPMYSLQPVGERMAAMGDHVLLLGRSGSWTRHEFAF